MERKRNRKQLNPRKAAVVIGHKDESVPWPRSTKLHSDHSDGTSSEDDKLVIDLGRPSTTDTSDGTKSDNVFNSQSCDDSGSATKPETREILSEQYRRNKRKKSLSQVVSLLGSRHIQGIPPLCVTCGIFNCVSHDSAACEETYIPLQEDPLDLSCSRNDASGCERRPRDEVSVTLEKEYKCEVISSQPKRVKIKITATKRSASNKHKHLTSTGTREISQSAATMEKTSQAEETLMTTSLCKDVTHHLVDTKVAAHLPIPSVKPATSGGWSLVTKAASSSIAQLGPRPAAYQGEGGSQLGVASTAWRRVDTTQLPCVPPMNHKERQPYARQTFDVSALTSSSNPLGYTSLTDDKQRRRTFTGRPIWTPPVSATNAAASPRVVTRGSTAKTRLVSRMQCGMTNARAPYSVPSIPMPTRNVPASVRFLTGPSGGPKVTHHTTATPTMPCVTSWRVPLSLIATHLSHNGIVSSSLTNAHNVCAQRRKIQTEQSSAVAPDAGVLGDTERPITGNGLQRPSHDDKG